MTPYTREEMEAHLSLHGWFAAECGPLGIAHDTYGFVFPHATAAKVMVLGSTTGYQVDGIEWSMLDDKLFWVCALWIASGGYAS